MGKFRFPTRINRSAFSSFVLHAGLVAIAFWLMHILPSKNFTREAIEVDLQTRKAPSVATVSKPVARASSKPALHKTAKLDLRPSYMQGQGILSAPASAGSEKSNSASAYPGVAELSIPPRVSTAFDHLAAQMNRNLDYPELFFKHGIQGSAILDLRFDENGKIDETASEFSGSHVAIRGLLVKASRSALQEWYHSDAYRLHREEFKGQHFLAQFQISYDEDSVSKVERSAANSYAILKRHKSSCVDPGRVQLDVTCTALAAEGMIQDFVSDNYKREMRMLEDRLNDYDDLKLHGINDLIAGS